ncbi:Mitochondrial 2-oxoglutarate/malate carrier protein [Fasciolopsis buskii]|uniref:Mitochondrial 2-oxoglutarate/malate carrier protein n=1 Tax=Fasciolopsis buskii TaxID=27845 RepID=A0A8E0VL37_9TREM|nr:Mitochondrial 2-oxoglutarate/malate carrier protein [Fasciolopsis buski]
MKFILGGCAGMSATVCVQPLDLVKNRMQMSGVGASASGYRNSFHALSSIIASEGFFAVYSGLSAGLLRQATYSTCRLGIYTSLFEHFSGPDGQMPNFLTKLGIAMTSGIIGSFVGTPSEVCLIRMTSDGRLVQRVFIHHFCVNKACVDRLFFMDNRHPSAVSPTMSWPFCVCVCVCVCSGYFP